jgi:hypothetical protein
MTVLTATATIHEELLSTSIEEYKNMSIRMRERIAIRESLTETDSGCKIQHSSAQLQGGNSRTGGARKRTNRL